MYQNFRNNRRIKICLVLISLLFSFISYGADNQNNQDKHALFDVLHPIPLNQWAWYGSAVYLKSDDTTYFGHHFETDYNWGYELRGIYHFTETKKFTIGWLKYTNENKRNLTERTPLFSEGETQINNDFSETLNVINMTLSQSREFDNRIEFDFYAGLQYFTYKNRKHLDFQSATSNSTIDSTQHRNSSGIGPRIGLTIDFEIFESIHLFADGAYAALAFQRGNEMLDVTSIDRRSTPAIDTSYSVNLKQNGPIGGQDGAIGVTMSKDSLHGTLNISGGLTGTAFDIDDTRFLGYFISATWKEND